MQMAIIEYELNPEVEDEFMEWIGRLAPHLSEVDGFLGADPAASLERKGRMYEISYWRDAQALRAWSDQPDHLEAKHLGKTKFLKWYRIRVGEVERDWELGPVPV